MLVALFTIPAVRKQARSRPFASSCAIFALSAVGSLLWQGWVYGHFDGTVRAQSNYLLASPFICLPSAPRPIALRRSGDNRGWQ